MAPPDPTPPSSSLSSHRLPTVSASQALLALRNKGPRALSTGLKQLDALLKPRALGPRADDNGTGGGFIRGQVTEIYGPPGTGKTALGLQAAKSALEAGGHVVWIDAATSVAKPRLQELLSALPVSRGAGFRSSPENLPCSNDTLSRFHRFFAPTLAHLLALLIHPPPSFPPEGTALVVVDSVSTLFDFTYPRTGAVSSNKTDDAKWAAGRRYAVMNELISKLGKMAAMRDIPVIVTNQTVTRLRAGQGALLTPAMAGLEWDNGIATRLVLLRDWPPDPGRLADLNNDKRKRIRYVGVVKISGVGLGEGDGLGAVMPFTIERAGLSDVDLKSEEVPMQPLTSPARPAKRTYTEVADSEDELGSDELYGWGEDDEVAAEGLIDDVALVNDLADKTTEEPPSKKRAIDED